MVRPNDPGFDTEGAGDQDAGIFGLSFSASEANVVLIPVPWEPTTSYRKGTARGPAAIAAASPQLDLLDAGLAEFGLSRPWAWGIHMLETDPQIRVWNEEATSRAAGVIERGGRISGDATLQLDLSCVNELSHALDAHVKELASVQFASGKIVGIVGGDHSAPLGAIQAATEAHGAIGILHIDAHADLRVAYEGFERSHASIMHNVLETCPLVETLVQVGIRDLSEGEHRRATTDPRCRTYFDHVLHSRQHRGENWAGICRDIVGALPERVWVSFDIDGLDPQLCPNTGTPVPGGLSFPMAVELLTELRRQHRQVIGFDLCEVAPGAEGDEWDGNVGARILYKLCGIALASAGALDA